MQNISFWKIVLLVVIIFVLGVAYKDISTGIQEKKEKAVIQERENVVTQNRENLQKCLSQAEISIRDRLKSFMDEVYACKTGVFVDVVCPTPEEFWAESDRIKGTIKVKQEECYKQYK